MSTKIVHLDPEKTGLQEIDEENKILIVFPEPKFDWFSAVTLGLIAVAMTISVFKGWKNGT